jgi:2-oxoglutarate ferredoxin oxidoreductase subunit gamma
MVDRGAKRDDITTIAVHANEIAEEIGDRKLTNMVAVGALLAKLPEISLEAVEAALKAHLPERHHRLLPKNYKALQRGFQEAKKQIPVAT